MVHKTVRAGRRVQIIREGDTMAFGDLMNLVLAVAVKGGPLKCIGSLDVVPVVRNLVFSVFYSQLTPFVSIRQANNQRAKLISRAGSVDMGLEEPRRAFVNLYHVSLT